MRFLVRRFLPRKEEFILRDTFVEIDKDSNGVLTRKEMNQAFLISFSEKNGEEISKIVDKIFGNLDLNEEGYIPYTSYLVGAVDKQLLLNPKYIKRAFKYFDTDKSERIDWMEFRDRIKKDDGLNDEVFKGMIG